MLKNGLYEQRIAAVLNYMMENLEGDLSLGKLSAISNYSPFHFQKIFKETVGVSPKQYSTQLRLENAAHYLVIHRDKKVSEIALDNGFSSNSTFARAFRKYYGVSAEMMRQMSVAPKNALYGTNKQVKVFPPFNSEKSDYDESFWKNNLNVNIKRTTAIQVIFKDVSQMDSSSITDGFKKMIGFTETHDLLSVETKFIGLINPHQQTYKAVLSLSANEISFKGILKTIIPAGKFATFVITGNTQHTFMGLRAFYELWLPQSGYRIADSNGYEILKGNPLLTPYDEIEREIHILIEPL